MLRTPLQIICENSVFTIDSPLGNKRPCLEITEDNDDNSIKRVRLGQVFHLESLKKTAVSSLKRNKFLGRGSFGIVEQFSLETGENIAMKKLSPGRSKPLCQENLLHEMELHSILDHENIIKFHSTVSEPELLAFAMEFAVFGSLYDALRKKDTDIVSNHVNIARGIAAGLAYLHSQNIMHGDLKTANIFLGEKKVPKIGDFGCAKNIESSAHLTLQGTSAILPPEALNGGSYSKAVDIYAFAFILWELITHRSPFQGKNYLEIFTLVCQEKKREIIPHATPKKYKKLIEECWRQRAEKRPPINAVVSSLTMCI